MKKEGSRGLPTGIWVSLGVCDLFLLYTLLGDWTDWPVPVTAVFDKPLSCRISQTAAEEAWYFKVNPSHL